MTDDDSFSFRFLLRKNPLIKFLSMLLEYVSFSNAFRNTFSFRQQDAQPLLLVGGSDGSGTRAFVDVLRELGAVVVADDRESFDVHAQALFRHRGWPGLIHNVLNYTHTADYEYEDLEKLSSPSHVATVEREVRYLLRELRGKYDINKRFYRRAYVARMQEEIEDNDYNELASDADGIHPGRGLSHQRRKGKPFQPKFRTGDAAPTMIRPTTFASMA